MITDVIPPRNDMRNVLLFLMLMIVAGCGQSKSLPETMIAYDLRIQIYGSCSAFENGSENPTSEASLLRTLNGHIYRSNDEDDCFGFWLIDEPEGSPIKNIGISGGYLSFEYDESSSELIASVEYKLERALTQLEIDKLVRYTSGQCSDGIGENFIQMGCNDFPVDVAPMTGSIGYTRIGF